MPTLRDRFASARAAWKSGSFAPPTAARRRPVRPSGRTAASPRPRQLRSFGPYRTRIEVAPVAPLDLKPDKWQRLIALGSILSVLVLAVGLYYTNTANREQQRLTAQGQITDRFTKAIEHLGQPGSDKIDVRLGGVYALERIMRDSADDHPAVMEILLSFIRVHAPQPMPSPAPTIQDPASAETADVDLRAALTVLGRRDPTNDQGIHIDLSGVNLPNARLLVANFEDAFFLGANLPGAWLSEANLHDTNLTGANLTNAQLAYADAAWATLRGVNLTDADLTSANIFASTLSSANMTRANLTGANLGEINLRDANLAGANLTDASLNGATLTGADLAQATVTRGSLSEEQLATARNTDKIKWVGVS